MPRPRPPRRVLMGVPPPESAEQAALALWLDARRLTWCHVPNGGWRHVATAVQLRAQGVKAGVPDVLIFDPSPRYPKARGVAIELKRLRGGRLAPEQQEWLGRLSGAGWLVQVCAGAQAAVDWLQRGVGY